MLLVFQKVKKRQKIVCLSFVEKDTFAWIVKKQPKKQNKQ